MADSSDSDSLYTDEGNCSDSDKDFFCQDDIDLIRICEDYVDSPNRVPINNVDFDTTLTSYSEVYYIRIAVPHGQLKSILRRAFDGKMKFHHHGYHTELLIYNLHRFYVQIMIAHKEFLAVAHNIPLFGYRFISMLVEMDFMVIDLDDNERAFSESYILQYLLDSARNIIDSPVVCTGIETKRQFSDKLQYMSSETELEQQVMNSSYCFYGWSQDLD